MKISRPGSKQIPPNRTRCPGSLDIQTSSSGHWLCLVKGQGVCQGTAEGSTQPHTYKSQQLARHPHEPDPVSTVQLHDLQSNGSAVFIYFTTHLGLGGWDRSGTEEGTRHTRLSHPASSPPRLAPSPPSFSPQPTPLSYVGIPVTHIPVNLTGRPPTKPNPNPDRRGPRQGKAKQG
jgi:hypothetical protein